MDRLRRLEILVRATEAGSFANAARLMGIDPSAVSHAVAQLEKDLGVTLFYRTTRKIALTEDGEEIFLHAREILGQVAELDTIASRSSQSLIGTLRLGMSVPIGRTIITPRLPAFMHRHPALRIECGVLAQVKEMHAGGFDMMLRVGVPPDTELIARKLADMRFGVYGAPAYLDAAGIPTEPGDLAKHRCFVHLPLNLMRPLDEWAFERPGLRRLIKVPRSLVTDDREGMIDAVLAGGGLMRIGMFDPRLVSSGRLRRVLSDWECTGAPPIYAFYRKSVRTAPKIVAFLQFVAETFADFDREEITLTHDPAFIRGVRRARR